MSQLPTFKPLHDIAAPQYESESPQYDNESAPPAYEAAEPPSLNTRTSSSSRSLQESEITQIGYKHQGECSQCCSDCLRCFHCCLGPANNTGTDTQMIGTLLIILTCGFCVGSGIE